MHNLLVLAQGLKNAIDDYLPAAEHRCCARHIHANWKKNHPGQALKNAFWRAAKASTVADFNTIMDEIKLGCSVWKGSMLKETT